MNDSREEQALMGSSKSDSEVVSEKAQTVKPHLTAKLAAIHAVHGLLVGVHVVGLVAAIKSWSIHVGFADVSWFPVASCNLLMP
jgi:hypothetical protein